MTSPSRSTSSSDPSSLPAASGLFLQPVSPPPPDPSSTNPSDESPTATSSPTTDLPTDAWSDGSAAGGETSDPGPSESSDPRSTGDLPKGSMGSRRELAKVTAGGFTLLTNAAHEILADDEEKAYGLYLPNVEEVQLVADSTAGLLSRRVPAGVGSPDMTDLLTLGLTLAGYVTKHFRLRREIRRARAGAIVAAPADQGDDVTAYPAAA